MKIQLLLFFLSSFCFAQSDSISCETLSKITKLIKEKHLQPKPIDDSLSVYVFKTFLENLDENNSLFLTSDIVDLNKHKFKIDNYINNQNCDFIDSFYDSYKKVIVRNSKIIETILKEPFSYSSKEFIQFYKDKQPHCKAEIDLKKRLKKRILFEILTEVAQVSANKDSILANFNSLADASKIKIFESYNCAAINKTITKKDFFSLFINSFCSYFDPHTLYFSSAEKSDFLSGLSSSNYSFGIEMTLNEKEELIVAEIIPYGAAYYADKIEVGDVIQKLKIDEIEYNFNCDNNDETYRLLFSNETKKVIFTFKKNNGQIYQIELKKQLMSDVDNTVYSYILENEKIKAGYIKIPSFYSKFENGKTNVSVDFKRELQKIIDKNIKKIIIDLKNNSGGSMQEAITMCGYFINAPVIGIANYTNNLPTLVGNQAGKPIFKGSIIILIDGNSASASEFFTNAMQDYGMAVVVGTTSFGKASIQEIFEIENKAKDFLKITIGSFYRTTGKSNQKIGITPNIKIPEVFENQTEGEKKARKALKNQRIMGYIEENSYPFNENQSKIITNYLFQKKSDPTIQKIEKLKKKMGYLFNENSVPIALNFNSVFDLSKSYNALFEDVKLFRKTEYPIEIFSTAYSNNSDLLNNSDKIGIKNIKTNFTIFEALKIISKF